MESFKQCWQGYITELLDKSFISRLTDLSNYGSDEEIEINYSEILGKDKDLLNIGAIFYFEIGKKNNKEYKRIEFNEMKDISKQDIASAELWAKEIKENITWK